MFLNPARSGPHLAVSAILALSVGCSSPVSTARPRAPVETRSARQVLQASSGLESVTMTEQKLVSSDIELIDGFGLGAAGAGDLDGDGYGDVVIGAFSDDDAGNASGAAYLYRGGASGADTSTEVKLLASDAAHDSIFGYGVVGPGDLNGDGYDDLLVGACRDNEVGTESGAVYLFYGSSSGLDPSTEYKITASEAEEGAFFGIYMGAAGDTDGDGFPEIAIGARGPTAVGPSYGAVYLYSSGPSGVDRDTERLLQASDPEEGAWFGCGLAGAGDVDGDGYDDLVVGALSDDGMGDESGAIYLYLGSSDGVDPTTEQKLKASDAGKWHYFGQAVSSAGDLDQDGYADIVVGAYGENSGGFESGAAYVYRGGSDGIDLDTEDKLVAPDGHYGQQFGRKVSGGGDVDGDGYPDIVVGAALDDGDGREMGAAYIFHGGEGAIDHGTINKLVASDAENYSMYGSQVSSRTDINADGCADIVVGAFEDGAGGAAYIYMGCCEDADGDGFCGLRDDCDDQDPDVYPGAKEQCDEIDNDCDGSVDEDVPLPPVWYADADGDGFGDPEDKTRACAPPTGFVEDGEDCDDTDAQINPDAAERCDELDNDCDGTVDGPASVDASTWQADADGDGYTVSSITVIDCAPPSGFAAASPEEDCDDGEASVHPGAEEIEGDGLDQDCDGADADADAGAAMEEDGKSPDSGCRGCSSGGSNPVALAWLVGLLGLVGACRRMARPGTR